MAQTTPPAVQETWVQSLGWQDPLEKGMITHSGILAWRIPWTEKPGGLQSMWLQRLRHDWVTNTFTFLYTLGLHLGWEVMFIWVGMSWKAVTQNIHSAPSDTAAAYPHVDLWNFKESTEGLRKHLQETSQALISGWGLMQERCISLTCINNSGNRNGVTDISIP